MPSFIDLYQKKVASGEIKQDPAQAKAAQALSDLATDLAKVKKAKGWLSFFSFSKDQSHLPTGGLYLYGGVGRGKTMLMDMFFDFALVRSKKRVHFHEFMVEVHQRLHILRHTKPRPTDPVEKLVEETAREAELLCFDEFHVSNIADAMILARFFSALWSKGVIIVATSNWAPENLYPNGLQRDRFLPFIPLLKKYMKVCALEDGLDYRMEGLKNTDLYMLDRDSGAESGLKKFWMMLSDGQEPHPVEWDIHSRKVSFERAHKEMLWSSFREMCHRPLGAIDYLEIAKKVKVILLERVPLLIPEKRDETKRFMTLIDVLYEAGTRLIISAFDEPEKLLVDDFYAPEFMRTISRLNEMRRSNFREELKNKNGIS